jgi:signal transduction histidine kinase
MPYQQITKVLIVDDLPENLQALALAIAEDGREIFKAQSGDEALSLMLDHDFALAILDVMMPGMNGFELAELMRATERTRNIPIVFVSAGGYELNFAFRGYEAGAVDFLYKPLDVTTVKSKVNVFVALHQKNSEVKQRVIELEKTQAELHETQRELELALKMRDDFMSTVAHELRTPLNTLHLENQIRSMQLDKGNTEAFSSVKLRAMLARDGRQLQSMIHLISDMVDVSRIQSGRLSIRPALTNLSGLLRRLATDLSAQADASGCIITLDIQDDVTGVWDDFRIEQIIINLLTNAMRYGCGQPIALSMRATHDRVKISVSDQGQGISKEDQTRIFEKFERGGNKSIKEGLGMGLYIAKQLTAAHDGELSVVSETGKGATFILKLPRNIDTANDTLPASLASTH